MTENETELVVALRGLLDSFEAPARLEVSTLGAIHHAQKVLRKVNRECARCGCDKGHYLHEPATTCKGCLFPSEHHKFRSAF